MPVVNGEILKCAMTLLMPDDVVAQNVFYWVAEFAASQTGQDVLDRIETFLEDFFDPIDANITNDVTADQGEVAVIDWDSGEGKWLTERVIGTVDPTITFTQGDDPLPNAVAATITAKTLRPRSNGRKAIGGLADTQVLDNNLLAGTVVTMLAAAAEWLATLTISAGNDLVPGVYRRGVDEFLPIISVTVPSVVGSMRTRKPGEGA